MYTCNCTKESYAQLQPLEISINNKFFSLPVESWMSYDPSLPTEQCKILLHPYDISMTATYKWVVGIQFLQHFYSIFDMANNRIGLIEAAKP